MKKIFTNNLPKWECGINKGKIKWSDTVGYDLKFIYNDLIDYISIIDVYKENNITYLKVKFKERVKCISLPSLLNCCLGNIIGVNTKDFKLQIGQNIKDSKRDFIIIDREYRSKVKTNNSIQNWKWYKYHCNKCGAELWMEERNLLKGNKCSCCTNQIIVKGINDVATTHPNLVKYFVNTEDGYRYSFGSGKKVLMKCNQCNYEKEITIKDLHQQGFNCPICEDGVSYPEKIMCNILIQLDVKFKKEYSSEWSNGKRYDFYFIYNNNKYIIETHGKQHYKESFSRCGGRTLKEEQENDKNKYELAVKNGIKPENYIVIDCRYSDLDFIKNNIINSRLNKIFNLSKVDWIKIGKDSEKSLIKEVCDYWHLHNDINNENLQICYLSKIFNCARNTIRLYLKRGFKLGWCNYGNV